MIAGILAGIGSIIFHEIGHILGAKKLKVFNGIQYNLIFLNIAIKLSGPVSKKNYIKILLLGILSGLCFLSWLKFFGYYNILVLIFYAGCCIPDIVNIFNAVFKDKEEYYVF